MRDEYKDFSKEAETPQQMVLGWLFVFFLAGLFILTLAFIWKICFR